MKYTTEGEVSKYMQQYLAVGDLEGTMHLMLMPRTLRKPQHNEKKQMTKILQHQILSLEDTAKRKVDESFLFNSHSPDRRTIQKQTPKKRQHKRSQQRTPSQKRTKQITWS